MSTRFLISLAERAVSRHQSIRSRLIARYGPLVTDTFKVVGEPTTVDDAAVLAKEDPFQFQAWALGLIGARPAGETKKGGDKGIDGHLYFHDEPGGKTKQIIVSVKAGHVSAPHVYELRGVIERESAEMGVLVSFQKPTAQMRSDAASAGFYKSPWGNHPRIQLLTIEELLDGKRIDYPPAHNVTFKQAEPVGPVEAESLPLPFGEEELAL